MSYRPHREVGRQGTGARARGERLCRLPRKRGRVTWLSVTSDEDAGGDRAGRRRSRAAKAALPGETRNRARRRSRSSTATACRTAGSRSSSTPTCARSCARSRPSRASPRADEAKAALAGAKALAGVEALQVPFVNGHFVREAVDFHDLPEGVEIVPLAEALAIRPRLAGAVSARCRGRTTIRSTSSTRPSWPMA